MNLYDELDVSKDATEEEIKKAFKKKANKTHPDKEGGSSEKFQIVQKAYSVLSNQESRKRYDETGSDKIRENTASLAMQELAGIFLEIVDSDIDLTKTNIVEIIRQHINNIQVQHSKEIQGTIKKIQRIDIALKRLKRKKKKGNHALIEYTLKNSKVGKEQTIRSIEKKIEIGMEMLDLLENYEYEIDAPQEFQPESFIILKG